MSNLDALDLNFDFGIEFSVAENPRIHTLFVLLCQVEDVLTRGGNSYFVGFEISQTRFFFRQRQADNLSSSAVKAKGISSDQDRLFNEKRESNQPITALQLTAVDTMELDKLKIIHACYFLQI